MFCAYTRPKYHSDGLLQDHWSSGLYLSAHFGTLRRSAANDKIFKLFFLHPFLASTIYNNTIKNKFDIG